jgi:putative oxygen-independent coproporphyrinogen III oxidase
MSGLYIHIPFCASRCIYCGFYSTTLESLKADYVEALVGEMMLRSQPQDGLQTIYLGGGTPSQLTHGQLEELFSYINKVYGLDPDRQEITMECNPDDVDEQLLAGLPVNRVSMGVQSFSDARLHWLHRRHDAREARQAVATLRRMGVGNISIDLMFGFPGETLDDWDRDIDEALRLDVEHISAYSLMYEEGTPLYRMLEEGRATAIDDDLSNRMYLHLIDRLTAEGYEHYEISNFARPGFRSRHNSSYWHDVPYIGLGAAAHSYDRKTRSWNVSDVRQYIAAIRAGRRPAESEVIDDNTHYDEQVMTALRTCEGLRLDGLSSRRRDYLLRCAQPYMERGLLAQDDGWLHLTRSGILISNTIMSDLMWDEDDVR